MQSTLSECTYVVRGSIESLAEVEVDNIQCPPLVSTGICSITEDNHVD